MTRWLIAPVCASALAVQTAPPQVFRAASHAVALDVAVFDGDHIVGNLGIEDFEVLDNGVPQTISAVEYGLLPIDLRLVFDTSGSISDPALERYLGAMREVTAGLGPDDGAEIITFNTRIADAVSRQQTPVKIAIRRGGPDGTAFFDAVSLAMVSVPVLDRRRIVIVLSDASDNTSFFDEATLLDVARRTDAVVYTILPAGPRPNPVSRTRLESLALLTGGRFIEARQERRTARAVITALDEFRHSYALRYALSGVPLPGWHKLEVNVRGPRRYHVRARAGYFG